MPDPKTFTETEITPLHSLDEWEEDVLKTISRRGGPRKNKRSFPEL